MVEITYQNVIDKLFATVPELGKDGDVRRLAEECGPHPVFGELTFFVINSYRSGDTGEGSAFQRSVQFLDSCLKSSDVEVQNLVEVSFLENLHVAEGDYQGLKRELGPALRRMLEKIDGKNPHF